MKKIILFLFIFPSLLACKEMSINKEKEHFDYDNVSEFIIPFEKIFDINSSYYYIYIYSLNCRHCALIKDDIINYRINYNVPIYFVTYAKDIKIIENINETIGKRNVEEIGILGTPTLLTIKEYELINNVAGEVGVLKDIKLYLNIE